MLQRGNPTMHASLQVHSLLIPPSDILCLASSLFHARGFSFSILPSICPTASFARWLSVSITHLQDWKELTDDTSDTTYYWVLSACICTYGTHMRTHLYVCMYPCVDEKSYTHKPPPHAPCLSPSLSLPLALARSLAGSRVLSRMRGRSLSFSRSLSRTHSLSLSSYVAIHSHVYTLQLSLNPFLYRPLFLLFGCSFSVSLSPHSPIHTEPRHRGGNVTKPRGVRFRTS